MRKQNSKVWWKQTVLNTQLPAAIASTSPLGLRGALLDYSDRVTVHLDKVSACCLFEEGRWDSHGVLSTRRSLCAE